MLAQAPGVNKPKTQTPLPDEDSAQQPVLQEHFPTLRVETRLVNVALNVADEHGGPVGELGRDDFELLEDGKPQKISYFEKESATPLSIVLAIDTSLSVLSDERLERNAARKFVDSILREQDELDLMTFSDSVREIVPFTNERKRIESGLKDLQRGSATALYNAIYLASDRLAETKNEAGRRRVLVLITDGEDTRSRRGFMKAEEEAQRAGAMIYSIIIVPIWADAGRSVGGEHVLIQLSNDTGGKFYYVIDNSYLESAFSHLSDDLRTQYVLGYYAPHRAGDNSFRQITVRMKDPALQGKYELRHRSGYYPDTK